MHRSSFIFQATDRFVKTVRCALLRYPDRQMSGNVNAAPLSATLSSVRGTLRYLSFKKPAAVNDSAAFCLIKSVGLPVLY
jgi:hypothetical protein